MTYFEKLQEYHSWCVQRLSDSTLPRDITNAEEREIVNLAVTAAKAVIHKHADIENVYAKARELLNADSTSPLKEHMIRSGCRYRVRIAKGHWQYSESVEEACKLAIQKRKQQ